MVIAATLGPSNGRTPPKCAMHLATQPAGARLCHRHFGGPVLRNIRCPGLARRNVGTSNAARATLAQTGTASIMNVKLREARNRTEAECVRTSEELNQTRRLGACHEARNVNSQGFRDLKSQGGLLYNYCPLQNKTKTLPNRGRFTVQTPSRQVRSRACAGNTPEHNRSRCEDAL